jgi:hypothetical protein
MSNFFPETDEEINIAHQKLVEEKPLKAAGDKQKAEERKRVSALLDGDETTVVSEDAFNELFDQFKLLVEKESGASFTSFSENAYTSKREGYKKEVYEKARTALTLSCWKREDIGTGRIFEKIISAIRLDKTENNLIDWRLADAFEKKGKKDDLGKYEEILFDFYLGSKADEESLNDFVEYFGKNYPLIAYLFFIKDKEKFMPNNPNHSDVSLRKLGVKSFVTSKRCSWKNYSKYNDLLQQIRTLLSARGISDVSLLDAHSFVWMIYCTEKRLGGVEI